MLLQSIPRRQIDLLLLQFLKRIYRFEMDIQAQFGLDYRQIYLLQYLRRCAPTRVSQIAAELTIPVFQATRLVAALERRAYLAREKRPGDRRTVWVVLLPGGETILQEIENRSYAIITGNAQNLTPDEIDSFLLASQQIDRILKLPDEP